MSHPRWEYKTVSLSGQVQPPFATRPVDGSALEDLLNILGRDGWELVQIASSGQWLGSGGEVLAILKRRVGEP